jgi:hypothetical protein
MGLPHAHKSLATFDAEFNMVVTVLPQQKSEAEIP